MGESVPVAPMCNTPFSSILGHSSRHLWPLKCFTWKLVAVSCEQRCSWASKNGNTGSNLEPSRRDLAAMGARASHVQTKGATCRLHYSNCIPTPPRACEISNPNISMVLDVILHPKP